MLPGKIRMKNTAAVRPMMRRYFVRISRVAISRRPRVISTNPDATTTKSGSSGNQVGTWARNAIRLEPR